MHFASAAIVALMMMSLSKLGLHRTTAFSFRSTRTTTTTTGRMFLPGSSTSTATWMMIHRKTGAMGDDIFRRSSRRSSTSFTYVDPLLRATTVLRGGSSSESFSWKNTCQGGGGFHSGLLAAGTTSTTTTTTTTATSTTRLFSTTTNSMDEETTTTTTTTTMQQEEKKASSEISVAGKKLQALRSRMKELNLDVYLVPSGDPHLSEYVPDAYKRRAFLTEFDGSAGTAVVMQEEAKLWTDSRYWNEANLQLDLDHWTLVKSGQSPDVPTITKFLCDLAVKHYQQHKQPLRIGLDPFVHPASFAKELEEAMDAAARKELDLEEDNGAEDEDVDPPQIGLLDASHENLIDPIWGNDRPAIPTSPFRVHPLKYAGVSVTDKIKEIREQMESKKASMAIFCSLDDVVYLLNVRAMGDVDTCPVGIAYVTVSPDETIVYCDEQKVQSDQIQQHFKQHQITIKPYESIVADIQAHCASNKKKNKVWLDTSNANYKLCDVIPKRQLIDEQNAITPMKACKNQAELEGMRRAHIVDGVAMAKFISWLQHTLVTEQRKVSEVEIDQKLTSYRAEQPGFLEVSFPTIAGVGSNGAIIHYRASLDHPELLQYLDTSQPILIDSGGQYEYGTTDVTRTWYFGNDLDSPERQEFIDSYTRVLKGHIGVDTIIFPENTPGFVIDVFARQALWEAGKDYGHGTGHGVGAALNVHEGPMSISPRWTNKETLKQGMILSNEPGYYEDGNYGVRIENLLEIQYVQPPEEEKTTEQQSSQVDEVEKATTTTTNTNGGVIDEEKKQEEDPEKEPKSNDGKKKFLKFQKLTMIPIQKSLINVDLLTEKELDWIDSYHQEVYDKISPLLEPDTLAMDWLQQSCSKINRKDS